MISSVSFIFSQVMALLIYFPKWAQPPRNSKRLAPVPSLFGVLSAKIASLVLEKWGNSLIKKNISPNFHDGCRNKTCVLDFWYFEKMAIFGDYCAIFW